MKCPICGGIGFKDGKFCICITKDKDDIDMPDFFKDIFREFDKSDGKKDRQK